MLTELDWTGLKQSSSKWPTPDLLMESAVNLNIPLQCPVQPLSIPSMTLLAFARVSRE